MNQEHRNNLLTPTFLGQIERGLESMAIDHSVSVIQLSSSKNQNFSNGTDFRTILHHVKSGESKAAADYLQRVYDL